MKNRYRHANLPKPVKQGLYDPTFEHDACGVGMVANIKGVKSHQIVSKALEALVNLGHRGAAGADPETGDGAGILIQIPDEFFRAESKNWGVDLPAPGKYGVGMTFIPNNNGSPDQYMAIIEETIKASGMSLIRWRKVPVDPRKIGVLADASRPYIAQFFVKPTSRLPDEKFEFALYTLRRVLEKTID